jgi:predicted enzyme related to lactoylglutathione lyase
MPVRTQHAPGTPSWIDLTTPDLAASKEFYGRLFGWDMHDEDTGNPDMPYVIASQDGKSVAGVLPLSPEMVSRGVPPCWTMYITVADVDASARTVAELGGSVVEGPMDVLPAGRMAVVADPAGAVFCLWQPKDRIGAELVNEPNSFVWDALETTDVETAKPFYGALFGWKAETFDTPPGAPAYTVWQLDGQQNAMGGATSPPDDGAPPHWGIVIAVADCDATVADAQQLGATVAVAPADVPGIGRSAKLVDPQGAAFRVMKMANKQS